MIDHTLHFIRLVLFGLLGFIIGGSLVANATTPTVTYSYGNLSPGYGFCQVAAGNDFASGEAAHSAYRAAVIVRAGVALGEFPPGVWSIVSDSMTVAEPYPRTGEVSLTHTDFSSPPGYYCNYQIVKIENCPAGENSYVFAPGDVRCRPSFCTANVGKYTSVTIPTGTTASTVIVAPTPAANICLAGCVANNVSGSSFGLVLDTTQTWSYSGVWRFTGIACADQLGLTTVTGFTTPSNSPPAIGTGSSSPSAVATPFDQSNSTNIGKIEANTANTATKIGELKDAFLDKFNITLGSGFTDCSAATTCTGDNHQCALALNARMTACALGPTQGSNAISASTALAGLDDVMNTTPGGWFSNAKSTVDLAANWDRPRWLTSTTCPVVPDFTVMGHSYQVSLTPICDYANLIALIVIVTSSMIAYRIISGGA